VGRFDGSYVLVGVDGSAAGERALRWAAEEARLRRMPLTVCHAWHWPYPLRPSSPAALDAVRRMGQHTLDKAVIIARETAPRVLVQGRLAQGPAAEVLVNQSQDAALALIGGHGQSQDAELAAGSSAVRLPGYAHCPVIVVRNVADRGRPIVVGVDGSAASEAALAFGFEEAALRGQPVIAIYGAWEPEELARAADPEVLHIEASLRLERTVSPWREKYPYVDARTTLVMRAPRHTLLSAAEGAGLLVLGGRGLGGVEGLRLGAVSSALLQAAPCSVAVVRPRE
jgi:nucleotide-binding universal stress UspA family protein